MYAITINYPNGDEKKIACINFSLDHIRNHTILHVVDANKEIRVTFLIGVTTTVEIKKA